MKANLQTYEELLEQVKLMSMRIRDLEKLQTEQSETISLLMKREHRYRVFVEENTDGIWCFDFGKPISIDWPEEKQIESAYKYAYLAECNDAMAQMYGFSGANNLIGTSLKEFLLPAEQRNIDFLRAFIQSGYKLINAETQEYNKFGEKRYFLNNFIAVVEDGKVHRAWGIQRDITDMKAMEQELSRTQKLESLGILAGGIAHDFNNILTVILGNLTLAKIYLDNSKDKVREKLINTENSIMKARDLTQQLLTFSKGGAPIKSTTSISSLLIDSTSFALSGSNIIPKFKIDNSLWTVDIDEGQISQVINNLVINSLQAMPEGGIINVSAENVKDASFISTTNEKYIKLIIQDNGKGIPSNILGKIFDPFFTTKSNGNGLGLSISHSIIKKHNGHINVESEPNTGTTFSIYLPASNRKVVEKEKSIEKHFEGEGNILVMDDNDKIRTLLGETLQKFGYETSLTKDGDEAIKKYTEAIQMNKPFSIVILDLTIPSGMGGKETIKKLKEIDPNIKAIVSSGYSTDPIMSNFKEYGFSDVVVKPYNIKELEEKLYSLIAK